MLDGRSHVGLKSATSTRLISFGLSSFAFTLPLYLLGIN